MVRSLKAQLRVKPAKGRKLRGTGENAKRSKTKSTVQKTRKNHMTKKLCKKHEPRVAWLGGRLRASALRSRARRDGWDPSHEDSPTRDSTRPPPPKKLCHETPITLVILSKSP